MTSEDRLTEIRDLLQQLLAQQQATARRHEETAQSHREAMAEYRAAVAAQRRTQIVATTLIVLVLALTIGYFALR